MLTLRCSWGGDLIVAANGDIAASPATDAISEKLIRRLLTNPGDYFWSPTFGGGLGAQVGGVATPEMLQAIIQVQLAQENEVLRYPVPTIEVSRPSPNPNGLFLSNITFQTSSANGVNSLSFVTAG
jgi:hypothetical protein